MKEFFDSFHVSVNWSSLPKHLYVISLLTIIICIIVYRKIHITHSLANNVKISHLQLT